MFDQMRTTAGKNSELSGAILKALQSGELSVRAMRAAGFRDLEQVYQEGRSNFRALAPLPDKAQVVYDTAVVGVGLQRLQVVGDLIAEGLTYTLNDPLSVTQLEWNKSNKIGAAQRTMSPSARNENKMPILLPTRTPIYLTTDAFEIDIRTLKMSQRVGMPLDTTIAQSCTRAVNEAVEDAAINGATTLDGQDLYVAGYTAYGLLNEPNVNTEALTGAAWTTAPVGDTVQTEVLNMVGENQADNKYGPYNLYVGSAIALAFNKDFKANGNDSIVTRLQQMSFGGRPLRVRTADLIPAKRAILVQMTSDVIDVIDGQRPTVIPWTSLDGFTIHNLIMSIMIPRVKSDYNGGSGVCVGSWA